jgi:hypothetical protein
VSISIVQQPDAYSFSATLKDTVLQATANVSVTLTDKATAAVILSETYTPDASGNVVIRALHKVLQGVIDPVSLIGNYTLSATCGADVVTFGFAVQYVTVEIDADYNTFINTRFLTLLQGAKATAVGRKEYLSLKVNTPTDVVATVTYSQAGEVTVNDITGVSVSAADGVVTVDVSPSRFVMPGYTLEKYVVTAGVRTQIFWVDNLSPAGASSFVFINSFGVKETFTCMGLLERENKYDDSLYGMFSNSYRKFFTNLVKQFTSNTGFLSQAVADWMEDLFLSKSIFLYDNAGAGKEVTILEPSVQRTSDPTELPALSFTWRYAQENQQLYIYTTVSTPGTKSRIFDKTFDKSFN